jgi:hypothetical protein
MPVCNASRQSRGVLPEIPWVIPEKSLAAREDQLWLGSEKGKSESSGLTHQLRKSCNYHAQ